MVFSSRFQAEWSGNTAKHKPSEPNPLLPNPKVYKGLVKPGSSLPHCSEAKPDLA